MFCWSVLSKLERVLQDSVNTTSRENTLHGDDLDVYGHRDSEGHLLFYRKKAEAISDYSRPFRPRCGGNMVALDLKNG